MAHPMRTLLLLLVLLTSGLAVAQPVSKIARVAFLATDPPTAEPMRWFDAFRQGLREHGWEEGRNVIIESKRANGQYSQLDQFASELVRSKVDVIVTDSTPAARAAMKATQTIPIVLALAGDPVGTGLVASFAHPGGNVTGLTLVNSELTAKRLELLRELIPTAMRVAVLWNPENASNVVAWRDAQKAARAEGVTLRSLQLRAQSDLDPALATVASWHAHAIWVFDDPVTLQYTPQIVLFALKRRLPTLLPVRAYTHDGGLLSYGASFTEQCRRAAIFVDKILRGAKPADLPIEQPAKFELVINLKTAKALALSIPESILVRADEIIK
jgi:putative ABC transport system substrate-binding protein